MLQSEDSMLREPNTFSNPSGSSQTSSALASSGSHPTRAIRIPKHLHTTSKIRLLKFSVDCHFPYYKHLFSPVSNAVLNE